jgi:hypothetical protein
VPSSSVISVGTDVGTNKLSDNYVCYSWSEVAGFSKFGSYTGSGSALTITTGFKPRYILIKSTDSAGQEWIIKDSERGGDKYLMAEDSAAESTGRDVTFNSDGFTLANLQGPTNWNGRSYIYAAFAEKPDGSIIDSLVDSPSQTATPTDTGAGGEVVGNYATFNSLAANQSAGGITISNGNLDITRSGGTNYFFDTTMSFSSGKWYWEMTVGSTISSYPRTGIWNRSSNNNGYPAGSDHRGWGAIGIAYSTSDISNGLPTFGVNDILMFAMDLDNGKLWFGKNGTWYSTGTNTVTAANIANNTATARFTDLLTESTGATWTPIVHMNSGDSWVFNAGQRSFSYAAPTNFKALNTANLPEPTIADGSKYFDTKLYTGNGSTQSVTGYNFSPDFVWLKSRNQTYNHYLLDQIRGAGKVLHSNNTDATQNQSDTLTSFNSDGFSLDSRTGVNSNNNTFVGWAWDAGSSNTTIAAGGLNSSVYDQSQTWSNIATLSGGGVNSSHPLTQGFNGNLSNRVEGDTNGEYLELPISTTIVSGGVRVYAAVGSTTPMVINLYNGSSNVHTTTSSTTGGRWHTTTYAGPITKIRIQRTGRPFEFDAVEVNGKILIDSGVSVTNVPSIASTVRANSSAGFSIAAASMPASGNPTIAHGLNANPDMLIFKSRTSTEAWYITHKGLTNQSNRFLRFDTSAELTNNNWFNNTAPTSSVVTLRVGGGISANENVIIYSFSAVEGYSAMGSYTGNGSADGPFIYTGFRPAWIMTKETTQAYPWQIQDTTRAPKNDAKEILYADNNWAEANSNANMDILSNGFKPRRGSAYFNLNGGTIIYVAFAENPFKTARAR